MAVVTRYTELTGCRVPVQQAPMGSVSTAALAVAVAEAGGVGTPPGAAATGHIDAMPMYAGESAAAITSVEPAAAILEAWSAAV